MAHGDQANPVVRKDNVSFSFEKIQKEVHCRLTFCLHNYVIPFLTSIDLEG